MVRCTIVGAVETAGYFAMSLTNLFVAAGQAFTDWRKRHKAYAELTGLDDRTLADIGIRRSEIAGIVYGNPQRTPTPAVSARRTRPALHNAA
jgi:uncharacterized protein YjiS (DUF1127 family)